jgi:hypothetical protein
MSIIQLSVEQLSVLKQKISPNPPKPKWEIQYKLGSFSLCLGLGEFGNLKYLKTYALVFREKPKINSPSQKSSKHQKSDFLNLLMGGLFFFNSFN